MQETIRKYTTKISDKWNSLDKSVKIKLIAIVVLLIAALALTIYLTARPKWVVFESNADTQTIGQIQNALNDAGIKNKVTKNASAIEIQEKDADQAKILIAESSIVSKGFTFSDAIGANNLSMSEADKNEMYLRVRETEIASLIENIDGVEKANVKLVLPEDTILFEKDENEASASVALVTSNELSKEQALTIARLVAMSVQNLDIKNIEIIDQNANSIYSGSSNDTASYSSKEEVEKQRIKEIENKVRASIVPLYDDVNIISNLKIDWNKRQQKTTTYTPPIDDSTIGVPSEQTKEEENVVNGTQGDAPGLDANDQTPANYAVGDNTNATYDASKDNTKYLYNTDETVITADGGEVIPDQSSISVVVYKYRTYDEALLKENDTINQGNTWEDFKNANNQETKLEIDQDLIESIRTGTGIQNVSVVGFEKPVFVDEVVKPLAIEQIIILAILAVLLLLLAFGLIRKTQPEVIEEIEPELSVEDLLVSTQIEEQKERERLADIDEVESEYKKQIEKFVEEKPDAVAQLLRNWLSDEWE